MTWFNSGSNPINPIIIIIIIIGTKWKSSWGNPCCQGIHDGGTLDNKHKYQSLALQFVESEFKRNFVVAIAMVVTEDSTAEKVVEAFEAIVPERTGLSLKELVGTVVADQAAQRVGDVMNIDSEICMMHSFDKLAESICDW